MISSARIYIFNVMYQGANWISISGCDQLSGMMANYMSSGISKLSFKNLQFINIYKNYTTSFEIHVNKIQYDGRRVLTKDDMTVLRESLRKELGKIPYLTFDQVLVINDEFTSTVAPAYFTNN